MNRLLFALALFLAAPLQAQTACDPAVPSRVTNVSVALDEDLIATGLPASNVVTLLRAPNQHSPIPYGDGFLCLNVGAGLERVGVAIAPVGGVVDFDAEGDGWYQVHYRDCLRGEPDAHYNLSNAVYLHTLLASAPVGLATHEYLFPGFNCFDVPYTTTECEDCFHENTVEDVDVVATITDPAVLDLFDNGTGWVDLEYDWWKHYLWASTATPRCQLSDVDSCGGAYGRGHIYLRMIADTGAVVQREVQTQVAGVWTNGFIGGPTSNQLSWKPARVKGVAATLASIEVVYDYWAYDAYGFRSPDPLCTLDVHFWNRGHVLDLRVP